MSNRKAWLLVVKLHKGKLHLLVPFSLAVLDETVVAVNDLVGIFSPVIRLPFGYRLTDPLNMVREFIKGIRQYPDLTLVQVETDEVKLGVNLY